MPESTSPGNIADASADFPPSPEKGCLDGEQAVLPPMEQFCANKMHLVSVLCNDLRAKSIVLHARFDDSMDKDSIVILQKSAFPAEPVKLYSAGLVRSIPSADASSHTQDTNAHCSAMWKADHLMSNDVYYRLLVTSGMEALGSVNMTVIHPAEEHHFKRFTSGGRRVVHETPALYKEVILPFLTEKPRDLSWVENIHTGKAEVDKVLHLEPDPQLGFVLVQDYRWDGKLDEAMHYLAIARDSSLTCLRDLRSMHIPMLQRIASEGQRCITEKHPAILADQLLAYLHYPPTFYWLHVHFVHANTDDDTLRAGRAHLLDEVIRNLESDGNYYAQRTMTVCLRADSPMWNAVQNARESTASNPLVDVTTGTVTSS